MVTDRTSALLAKANDSHLAKYKTEIEDCVYKNKCGVINKTISGLGSCYGCQENMFISLHAYVSNLNFTNKQKTSLTDTYSERVQKKK